MPRKKRAQPKAVEAAESTRIESVAAAAEPSRIEEPPSSPPADPVDEAPISIPVDEVTDRQIPYENLRFRKNPACPRCGAHPTVCMMRRGAYQTRRCRECGHRWEIGG